MPSDCHYEGVNIMMDNFWDWGKQKIELDENETIFA